MRWQFGLLLTMAAAAFGCGSGISVNSDFDPTASFRDYNTWDWMPAKTSETGDPRLDDAILHGRIESAVANTLLDRGFKLEPDTPDFFVAYHVAVDEKLDVEVVNNYYGYSYEGDYAAVWGPSISGQEVRTTQWEQGTLLIDVLDGQSKLLVWRGSAQSEVYPDTSPNERQKRINQAVKKVLDQFPPR